MIKLFELSKLKVYGVFVLTTLIGLVGGGGSSGLKLRLFKSSNKVLGIIFLIEPNRLN